MTSYSSVWCTASYRDLKAWQHAKAFSVICNRLSRKSPPYEQQRGLADQLRRAASSAALNIAEGSNKSSNREFRRYLETSRTSLDEGGAILEISVDSDYITKAEFELAIGRRDEAARTLFGLLRAINQRIDQGEIDRRKGLRGKTDPDRDEAA